MDYQKLKKEIKEIVDIAEGVPEVYKEKCFEGLLNYLLQESTAPPPSKDDSRHPPKEDRPPPAAELPITTQLRVFMQRNSVSEEELKAVLMVAEGEVYFLREPSHGTVVDGQIQWALLLALKNCILNNELSVDPEDVRSVCQDKGFYDAANFAAHFKKAKYSKLFKGPMEKQGDPQGLTPEGQTELAKVIRKLATD
jgi:hypothetical protein